MTNDTTHGRVRGRPGAGRCLLLALAIHVGTGAITEGSSWQIEGAGNEARVEGGPCRETTLVRFPPIEEVQALLPAPLTALPADEFFASIGAFPPGPEQWLPDPVGIMMLATFDCGDPEGDTHRILAILLGVNPMRHPAIADDGAAVHFFIRKPGYSGAFLEAASDVGLDVRDVAASTAWRESLDVVGERLIRSAVSMVADGEPWFDASVGFMGAPFRDLRIDFHLWGRSEVGLIANQFIGSEPEIYVREFESCAIAGGTDAREVFGDCGLIDGAVQAEYPSVVVNVRHFPGLSIEELVPE